MFGVSPKKKRKRKPKETVVDGVTIKVNPGKFKNQITNGYHSKKEYERSLILKDMLAKGEIANLRDQRDHRDQVSYELIPKQQKEDGKHERAVHYIADFVYEKDGKTVVEDVKGMKLPEYVIKRKLMLFIHKIEIQEV
jgi:hypothetical protein